jgi:hypothetical protein
MEKSLENRIKTAKETIEEFDINHRRLAEFAERSYVTVSRVLNGKGDYVTETNVSAIEAGIEKILNKYRAKLCK